MKTKTEIRKAANEVFGSGNVRITRNDEIHVRGKIPSTNEYGWYLFGFVGQVEVEDRLWYPDGSIRA